MSAGAARGVAGWELPRPRPAVERPRGTASSRPASGNGGGAPPAGYRRNVRHAPAGSWPPEAILRAFREWSDEWGRTPTVADWSPRADGETASGREASASGHPSPTTVRRHFGSWSAALERAGLRAARLAPWELGLDDRVAAAQLLSARGLRSGEIAPLLGVAPATVRKYLHARVCADCRGPLVTATASRCHDCDARSRRATWSAAATRAALREWSRDRDAAVEALRDLASVHGRRPRWSDLQPTRAGSPSHAKIVSLFGSFGAALEAAGFRARGHGWARGEVLAALRSWSHAHGRPPTCTDWSRTTSEHPGARAVAELFGGWSAALVAAGLRNVGASPAARGRTILEP